MKPRSFILRCAAFILLLVFSQKAGRGLLLHNLLHANQAAGNTDAGGPATEVNYACNCIDDFLMPFVGEEAVIVPSLQPAAFIPSDVATVIVPFRAVAFASLRGPPACLLS